MSEPTDAEISAVLTALATPKFKWRTIPGVAKETGLAQEIVHRAIAASVDRIIKSSVPSTDGQDLFTTREHFRKQASVGERLLSAVKNRGV